MAKQKPEEGRKVKRWWREGGCVGVCLENWRLCLIQRRATHGERGKERGKENHPRRQKPQVFKRTVYVSNKGRFHPMIPEQQMKCVLKLKRLMQRWKNPPIRRYSAEGLGIHSRAGPAVRLEAVCWESGLHTDIDDNTEGPHGEGTCSRWSRTTDPGTLAALKYTGMFPY